MAGIVVRASNCEGMTPKNIYKRSHRAVVLIASSNETGTGFIVRSDGLILTAQHVVGDAKTVVVTLDGKPVQGRVLKSHILHDYAYVKIDGQKSLPTLTIGASTDAEIGDEATLIAFPFSPPFRSPDPVLLSCMIAGKRKIEKTGDGTTSNTLYFQGPFNKGASGGPLILNRTGRVIGIANNTLTALQQSLLDAQTSFSAEYSNAHPGGPEKNPDVRTMLMWLIYRINETMNTGMGFADAIEQALPMPSP
jgi:S1-C subfamily serine protease